MSKPGSFRRSFGHSWEGIVYVFKTERNFRVEAVIGVLVLAIAFFLEVASTDAAVLVLIITLILLLEVLNTLVERFVDALKPTIHPFAKHIKDMTAGMVLLASVASIIIGLFIFLPYLTQTISIEFFKTLW